MWTLADSVTKLLPRKLVRDSFATPYSNPHRSKAVYFFYGSTKYKIPTIRLVFYIWWTLAEFLPQVPSRRRAQDSRATPRYFCCYKNIAAAFESARTRSSSCA